MSEAEISVVFAVNDAPLRGKNLGGHMANLESVRIKPNPTGKDRSRYGGASPTQLGAEWVDVKNVSQSPVNLNGVKLYHIAYSGPNDSNGHWDEVISFSGTLQPGQVIRVHSGSGPQSVLRDEDVAGATYHFFTGKNYVWNNDRSDRAALWVTGQSAPFDQAYYDANPPEGVVLERVGDRFLAPSYAAAGRRY